LHLTILKVVLEFGDFISRVVEVSHHGNDALAAIDTACMPVCGIWALKCNGTQNFVWIRRSVDITCAARYRG
jgi:hypothetical protein